MPFARRLRIGMAQVNVTVGDFAGNERILLRTIEQARSSGVEILVFPELAVCGYPPEDLLFKPAFIADNLRVLETIAAASTGITVITGFVDADDDVYNAAAVLHDGHHAATCRKMYLPNYGVFDENRYFRAGNTCAIFHRENVTFGVTICEDIWYENGPASAQADSGAELIINISSSPFHTGKTAQRERMIATRAADNTAIFAYVNMVGGQDELVFDGNSLLLDEQGQCMAKGKAFQEELLIADIDIESVFRSRLHDTRWRHGIRRRTREGWQPCPAIDLAPLPATEKPAVPRQVITATDPIAEVYEALVLGTHDYVKKNGFSDVVIGLSGGLDSSLVAAIASDALGAEHVTGVAMPSRYSSPGSLADAQLLANNLGTRLMVIPIEQPFQAFLETLRESFGEREPDVTEENIQSRVRGTLIMALSNKFGWLVLTTGNKSEMATGYATLYGDMAGGFAVIKDVPKTLAYDLCRYRNRRGPGSPIPETVLTKPPSAELRPGQQDTDSLPPYEVLDPILAACIEEDRSIEQVIAAGFDEAAVRKVFRLVNLAEYKRRQSPPGVKITERAFGRDRRLPITNHYLRDA